MKTTTSTAQSPKAVTVTGTNPVKSKGSVAATTEPSPFEKMFLDMLKGIYWAEQHLVEALKKMSAATTTESLKDAFEDHRHVTEKQAKRLEKIFALLETEPEAEKCDAMAALVEEGEKLVRETEEGSMTRDAGLIISAQKVEHYEIATYGSLVQVALTLGHDDVAMLLEKTLKEEEDTDRLLTDIAETEVNPLADGEDAEGTEEETESGEEEEVA